MEQLTRHQAADALRDQAASCRRLAAGEHTASNCSALTAVAERFDDDARRIDPQPRNAQSR